jgi:uncharacterized protein YidB (DUF937 family)
MGLLDNVLGSAVPGGDLAKPLTIALMGLIASRAMSGGGLGGLLGGAAAPAPSKASAAPTSVPSGAGQGGFAGGLGSLLEGFQQAGQGKVADSWVAAGPNQPISPEQLHQTLGPQTVNDLSRQTGLPPQVLMQHLSQILPTVIDKLTPDGRVPNKAAMSRW